MQQFEWLPMIAISHGPTAQPLVPTCKCISGQCSDFEQPATITISCRPTDQLLVPHINAYLGSATIWATTCDCYFPWTNCLFLPIACVDKYVSISGQRSDLSESANQFPSLLWIHCMLPPSPVAKATNSDRPDLWTNRLFYPTCMCR